MKVSVIIAVYNTEQYLPECLDSLLNQTYQDWEAWCVDDCSTDNSLSILKDYAFRDERFKVVQMPVNGGQAKARNHAIRQCSGDLIAFLDSDDWLSNDGLEKVVQTFTQHPATDCVLWDCQYVYADRTERYKMKGFEVMSGKEAFELSLNWQIHGVYVTTAKLHKQYLFDDSAKWCSDDNTTRIHYMKSREVRLCSGIYYYRQHEESVTHAINIHHFDFLDANDSMLRQLKEHGAEDRLIKSYEKQRWMNIIDCYQYFYVNRDHFSNDEKIIITNRLRKSFNETNFSRLPKTLMCKFGYSSAFGNWTLFRLQEEVFFWLRSLLGRNTTFILFFLTMLLCLPTPSSAQDMSKMSRFVRQAALTAKKEKVNDKNKQKADHTKIPMLTALVKTSNDNDQIFTANNCRCYAHWDNIHIAAIPLSTLADFSQLADVKRIEAKEPCSINIDTVRITNQVLPLHVGDNLPQAYTGKGVVIGVEDIGFDLTHPTFYSSDMQDYRIRRFWDMLDNENYIQDSIAGSELIVGKDFVTREEILAKSHAIDGLAETHGTHTAGIAAGSGSEGSCSSSYIGMAPEADLCLVANAVNSDVQFIPEELLYKYTIATDILGFKYIFDYAESVNKPCVISFSEGAHEDLYGDCQLMYDVLEKMGGPGRIIVASAGNEGENLSYLHKPQGQEEATSLLRGKKALYTLRSNKHHAFRLDFYNNSTKVDELSFKTSDIIQLPDSMLTDTLTLGGKEYSLIVASYPSCYNEQDWATELLLQCTDDSTVGDSPYLVTLSLVGIDADIEAFTSGGQFYNSKYFPDFQQTEQTHSIHFPSAAPSVICVGNSAWRRGVHNYKGEWKEYDQGTKGVRSATSSVGPTMQGIIKPDVIAPGTNVISAYSSYYLENNPDAKDILWDVRHFEWNGRTYSWNSNSGTSMSTPVVAGIIALWLEACPTLTPDDVMQVIAATSQRYDSNADYPNNEYGWGEIDAYAGLLHVLGLAHIKEISHSQPSQLSIRPDGSHIVVRTAYPLDSDVSVSIYNLSGAIVQQHLLPQGQSSYDIPTSLPDGVYVIQCNSHCPDMFGSTLVRLQSK